MQQVNLSRELQEQIKQAMEKRDLVGLGSIIEQTELPKSAKELLKQIPLLHGREEMLKKAYDMVVNEQSKRALDNLQEIFNLLKAYGAADYVNFDLGVIRDFGYYTGMVFEAYAPGLGFPVCGGGRYDHMLSDFGNACPATGFALGIERVMLALERQGQHCKARKTDIYVAYGEGAVLRAIETVTRLRQNGKTAELALQAQSRKEAQVQCDSRNCVELVFVD
jgi:ATP phosphoribosyltransferase regulatory subunit